MNRLSRLAVFALFPVLVGCPKGSHAYIEDMHAVMIELKAILVEVTDRESAEAAKGDLEDLGKRMQALQEKYKDVEPTEEQKAEYERVVGPIQKELTPHFMRIGLNPELRFALEGLESFGSSGRDKKSGGNPTPFFRGGRDASGSASNPFEGVDAESVEKMKEHFKGLGINLDAADKNGNANAAAVGKASQIFQERIRQAQEKAMKEANSRQNDATSVSDVGSVVFGTWFAYRLRDRDRFRDQNRSTAESRVQSSQRRKSSLR